MEQLLNTGAPPARPRPPARIRARTQPSAQSRRGPTSWHGRRPTRARSPRRCNPAESISHFRCMSSCRVRRNAPRTPSSAGIAQPSCPAARSCASARGSSSPLRSCACCSYPSRCPLSTSSKRAMSSAAPTRCTAARCIVARRRRPLAGLRPSSNGPPARTASSAFGGHSHTSCRTPPLLRRRSFPWHSVCPIDSAATPCPRRSSTSASIPAQRPDGW